MEEFTGAPFQRTQRKVVHGKNYVIKMYMPTTNVLIYIKLYIKIYTEFVGVQM